MRIWRPDHTRRGGLRCGCATGLILDEARLETNGQAVLALSRQGEWLGLRFSCFSFFIGNFAFARRLGRVFDPAESLIADRWMEPPRDELLFNCGSIMSQLCKRYGQRARSSSCGSQGVFGYILSLSDMKFLHRP